MSRDVLINGKSNFPYTSEDATPDAIDSKIAEEAFHHIEPGRACRSEMNVEARISCKPSFDLFMFVRGVVVANDMDVLLSRDTPADQVQETNPLLMAVLFHACANDFAIKGIHRSEQRGSAVAFVIVGHRLATPFLERQAWLSAIQCLNLAFFVTRKDNGVLGRAKVEADNILEFFLKPFCHWRA